MAIEKHLVKTKEHILNTGEVGYELHWANGSYSSGEPESRIKAVVYNNCINFERVRGIESSINNITLSELELIHQLGIYWQKIKNEFAAYHIFFDGLRAHFWFYEPGKEYHTIVGSDSSMIPNSLRGEKFRGKDVCKKLEEPKELHEGITIVEEQWRIGEKIGNPEGEKTGIVCKITDDIKVVLTRFYIVLCEGIHKLQLDNNDLEFLGAILNFIKRRKS